MIINDKDDKMLIDYRTRTLVRKMVPAGDALQEMADFFSTLADATRIRIVSALSISPMCVNDISAVLELNQTTVSHQLRNLKNIGVVKCKRQGKVAFYSLCDGNILDAMLSAVKFIG
ncbi:MAG: metalloregulator ArsR/SmtB family transcription factor [Clostridiales bacterium]|jgi:ArsR family transcriptional regulator|nr:metalloregulator ArsR/SmtB family transcription factor [Clostridiales bacterium]